MTVLSQTAVIQLDQFPSSRKDGRRPLPLPELNVKRTVEIFQSALSLHDEAHPGRWGDRLFGFNGSHSLWLIHGSILS
jgi:hypothetical protein